MSFSQCGNPIPGCEQGKNPGACDAHECIIISPFSRVGLEQYFGVVLFDPSLRAHLLWSLALSHSFFSYYAKAVMKLSK